MAALDASPRQSRRSLVGMLGGTILCAVLAAQPLASRGQPAGAATASAPSVATMPAPWPGLERVRQALLTDKRGLIQRNLPLTPQEAQAFWPIYDAYQADLAKIDRRYEKVLVAYYDAYYKGAVPNAVAEQLMTEALKVQKAEVRLMSTYRQRLKPVLPATKIARYLQLELKARAVMNMDGALKVPLID